jgi:CRISPR-associated protein Csx3
MLTLQRLAANYQILAIAAKPVYQPIKPDELATIELPPDLDLTREVILFGQVPTWVYGALIQRCRAAPWIGCYAALEGEAVVIHSQVLTPAVGDVVPVQIHRPRCPTILIGGPPDSGKSVFSNALRLSLLKAAPDSTVYLHRANWDGEGNWSHEAHNRELIKRLIRQHERRIHEHPQAADLLTPYFNYHAQAIAHLQKLADWVLVDVGGKIQPEKIPLLHHCTHFLLISRDPEQLEQWQAFCQPHLKAIALIHSTLDVQIHILKAEPWLELIAGPWLSGTTPDIPAILLDKILLNSA